MITHSPHTISNRTEHIGTFFIPDVSGHFEVRSMKNRKQRPLIMVLRSDWESIPVYEKIPPVIELIFEKNGELYKICQVSLWQDLKNLETAFSKHTLELLSKNQFHNVKKYKLLSNIVFDEKTTSIEAKIDIFAVS